MGYVGEDDAGPVDLTLHSSWRGLALSTAGSLLVVVAGLIGVLRGGWRVFPTLVLVCGVGFLLVVLLDYPVASTFTIDGVRRRMPLRSQFFGWERVDTLTRARPGLANGLRGMKHGGLAAVVGKRRYLLVDQPESAEEFDQLYPLVADGANDVMLGERMRPFDGTPPTWLYRRAKWAPPEAKRR
jgi:hypothetical protein